MTLLVDRGIPLKIITTFTVYKVSQKQRHIILVIYFISTLEQLLRQLVLWQYIVL